MNSHMLSRNHHEKKMFVFVNTMSDNNCKSVIIAKGDVYQILGMGELNLKTDTGNYLTLSKEQVNSFVYHVENRAELRGGMPFHVGEHLFVFGDANINTSKYLVTKCKSCCNQNHDQSLGYALHLISPKHCFNEYSRYFKISDPCFLSHMSGNQEDLLFCPICSPTH